jgi:myo-inositol catabolism protein IolC
VTDIPATGPALADASPAPGGRSDDRVLLILAADHRNSLERDLYGLTAPPTPTQAARVSADKLLVYQALAARAGRQARCVVLGRHAPPDKLGHWLQVAAPIPGWSGFAIGRSIWWDALHAHLHHHCTAGEARHRISDAYLGYAQYYLSARDGMLTSQPDPEFW